MAGAGTAAMAPGRSSPGTVVPGTINWTVVVSGTVGPTGPNLRRRATRRSRDRKRARARAQPQDYARRTSSARAATSAGPEGRQERGPGSRALKALPPGPSRVAQVGAGKARGALTRGKWAPCFWQVWISAAGPGLGDEAEAESEAPWRSRRSSSKASGHAGAPVRGGRADGRRGAARDREATRRARRRRPRALATASRSAATGAPSRAARASAAPRRRGRVARCARDAPRGGGRAARGRAAPVPRARARWGGGRAEQGDRLRLVRAVLNGRRLRHGAINDEIALQRAARARKRRGGEEGRARGALKAGGPAAAAAAAAAAGADDDDDAGRSRRSRAGTSPCPTGPSCRSRSATRRACGARRAGGAGRTRRRRRSPRAARPRATRRAA